MRVVNYTVSASLLLLLLVHETHSRGWKGTVDKKQENTAEGLIQFSPVGMVREASRGADIELVQEKEGVEVLQPRAADAPTHHGPDALPLLSGQDHLQLKL